MKEVIKHSRPDESDGQNVTGNGLSGEGEGSVLQLTCSRCHGVHELLDTLRLFTSVLLVLRHIHLIAKLVIVDTHNTDAQEQCTTRHSRA